MTNAIDQETPDLRASYSMSVWEIVPCMLWLGLALLIQAGWMWARSATRSGTDDLDLGAPFVIGPAILGVCSLGLFLVAIVRRAKAKGDRATLASLDTQLRQLLWVFCLVGGGVMVVLSAWLYLAEKSNHVFPEVSSLAVLGLILLGSSVCLKHTPRSALSQQGVLQGLLSIRQQLAIGLIVVGVVMAGLGAWCVYRAGRADFFVKFAGGPEGMALILIGLVFAAGGLFTQLTLDRPATSDNMRLLTLYLGSLTGLIIFLTTAMRTWGWMRTFLAGGIRSWQGEEAWRFWLCAYVGLFGLLLLFGSLLLSRVDIRVNAGIRRVLYGYNAFFTGMLVLALLVLMIIMVSVIFPSNVEWNPIMGMQSLSSKSKNVLESLKERVTVYVLMSRGSQSYLEVRDLLDNCQGVTDKITVQEVSPDLKDVEYRKLVDKYPELAERTQMGAGGKFAASGGRGLLIAYGDAAAGKKPPHRFIADTDLEDLDRKTERRQFLGEKLLMQNIQQLVLQGTHKPKIYTTQGHGELWINDVDLDRPGLSDRILRAAGGEEYATMLRKDNFDVVGLIWEAKPSIPTPEIFAFSKATPKAQHEVPEDCTILLIVNPEKAFAKDELEAIDRYMDKRNGKLMIASNAGILKNGKFADDGLEDLCKKYNVQMGKDFILRYTPTEEVIRVKATVVPNTQNKAAREFLDRRFYFTLPRTVTPMKGPSSAYQVDPILQVSKDVNGPIGVETDSAALRGQDPIDYVARMMERGQLGPKTANEPLIVGVAITDRDNKPRGVVLGNYTFISSFELLRSPDAADNYDFFRSCLSWLAESEIVDIGISPKSQEIYRPKEVSKQRLIWLPLALLVLTLGGMGAGIWIVRRK